MKYIELQIIPTFEEKCETHNHTGEMPCPWPNCQNGIQESSFIGSKLYGLGETQYNRKQWLSIDGSERYSWDDANFFSLLQADKLIREEIIRTLKLEPIYTNQREVYHYTSMESLYGIIKSHDIWLTDYEFMNDSKEIKHGLNIAQNVLDKFGSDYKNIINDRSSLLCSDNLTRISVSCFSTDKDSLSQWRGYGSDSNVGICIGFNYLDPFWASGFCQFNRVIYNHDIQEKMIGSSLFQVGKP